MNILIINHYAGSKNMGMEYRPYFFCKNFAEMGNNCAILTSDYTHLRIKNPYIKNDFDTEEIEKIKYIYVKTNEYYKNNSKRAKNIFKFIWKAYFNAKKIIDIFTPDVVIASSTYPFDIIIAKKIAKLTNAKIVFELHDIWPLSLIELYGYSEKNPIILLTDYYEKKAYKNADLVISVLSNAKEYFDEKNVFPKKYIHIPNGIEIKETNENDMPNEHLKELEKIKLEYKFIVMYCGGFNQGNNLEYFVNTASGCEKDVAFVGVGNGPLKIKLKRLVRKMDIDNVFFLDAVPKNI